VNLNIESILFLWNIIFTFYYTRVRPQCDYPILGRGARDPSSSSSRFWNGESSWVPHSLFLFPLFIGFFSSKQNPKGSWKTSTSFSIVRFYTAPWYLIFRRPQLLLVSSRCVSHTLKECVGYHTLTIFLFCGTLEFSKITHWNGCGTMRAAAVTWQYPISPYGRLTELACTDTR